jgi:hypothetical protein
MKVLDETFAARSLHLELEGQGGSDVTLMVRRNGAAVKPQVEGGEIVGDELRVHFRAGRGYVTREVTLRW